MTNLSQIIGIPPAPTVSDLLSDLVSSEVSISSATTLTSTAFGKMHVVSGSSDYTIGLPAASGNSGKIIGIRITGSALFTIDGNGSEEIDGETTRVMWAGESAILLCDGTGWTKIAGKSIPFELQANRNTIQTFTAGTTSKIIFNNILFSSNSSLLSSGDFVCPRKSTYNYSSSFRSSGTTSNYAFMLWKSGIRPNFSNAHDSISSTTNKRSITISTNIKLDKNDLLSSAVYTNTTIDNQIIDQQFATISVTEIPTW